jgi:hypothetical protein
MYLHHSVEKRGVRHFRKRDAVTGRFELKLQVNPAARIGELRPSPNEPQRRHYQHM